MKKNFRNIWKVCVTGLNLAICSVGCDEAAAMNKTENATIPEEFRSLVKRYEDGYHFVADAYITTRMLQHADEINDSYSDKGKLRKSWNILLRHGLHESNARVIMNRMFAPCLVQNVWSMLEPDTVLTYYAAAFYNEYTQSLRGLPFENTPSEILVDLKQICAKQSLMIKVILLCYASEQPDEFLEDFERRTAAAKTHFARYEMLNEYRMPNVFAVDIQYYTRQFEDSRIGSMRLDEFLALCKEICSAEDPGASAIIPEWWRAHLDFDNIVPFNCPKLQKITRASVDLGVKNRLCTDKILSSGVMEFTDGKIVYDLYAEQLGWARPYTGLEMYCFFPALFIKVVRELYQRYSNGELVVE